MKRKGEDGRKFTLRISENLGREIDGYVENTGMSIQEFIRRACWEKLERDKILNNQIREPPGSYLSQDDFNTYLKAALQNNDIKKIIISIIKN